MLKNFIIDIYTQLYNFITIVFCISLILLYYLYHGISFESIKINNNITLENVYISLSKKTIIENININNIETYKIDINKTIKNNFKNIKYLYYLNYLNELEIKNININNIPTKINYKKNKIKFINKYLNIDINKINDNEFKINNINNQNIKLYDGTINILNNNIIIKTNLDIKNIKGNLKLNYNFNNKINYFYKSENFTHKDFIEIKNSFNFPYYLNEWIFDKNKSETFKINNINGTWNINDKLKNNIYNIKADIYVKNVEYIADYDLSPFKSKERFLTINNDELEIKTDIINYKNEKIKNTKIYLGNFSHPIDFYVKIMVKKNKRFFYKELQEFLKLFNINIGLIQKSGFINFDFSILSIPEHNNEFIFNGEFEFENVIFNSFNKNIFVKNGTLKIINNEIINLYNSDIIIDDILYMNNINFNILPYKSLIKGNIEKTLLKTHTNNFKKLNKDLDFKFNFEDMKVSIPYYDVEAKIDLDKTFINFNNLVKIQKDLPIIYNLKLDSQLNNKLNIELDNITKNITGYFKLNTLYDFIKLDNKILKELNGKFIIKENDFSILLNNKIKILNDKNKIIINGNDIILDLNKLNIEDIKIKTNENKLYEDIIININDYKIHYQDFNIDFKTLKGNYNIFNKFLVLKLEKDSKILDVEYYKDKINIKGKNVKIKDINFKINNSTIDINEGVFNFDITKENNIMKGNVQFNDIYVNNVKTLNNIVSFIDTIPSLIIFKDPGFTDNKFKFENGEFYFNYDIKNSILDFFNVKAYNKTLNYFSDLIHIDFNKNIINSNIKINLLKNFSKILSEIPILSYILIGEDDNVSIFLSLNGNLDNSDIDLKLLENFATTPINIIKRTLYSPIYLLK